MARRGLSRWISTRTPTTIAGFVNPVRPANLASTHYRSGAPSCPSPANDPCSHWCQDAQGLHISVMSANRLYNMWDWTNPLVVKTSHPAV